jgi:intein/homing endonuclease
MKQIEPYIVKKDKDGNEYTVDNPEYLEKIQNEKFNFFLKRSGIPSFYHNINFKDYKGNKDSIEIKQIIHYANNCHKEKFNHVHLYLWGLQSTQKCITQDSLILTENGFYYINDFSSNKFGFIDKKISLLTDMGIKDSSHFFEEKTNNTIKIELQNGISIEGTSEHPIKVLNKDFTFSFKKLQDIDENDFVLIQKNSQIFNKIPFVINFKFNKNKYDYSSKELGNIPKYLNSDLSRFLGYYIANGNKGINSLNISTKNFKIKKDLNLILNKFDLNFVESKDMVSNRVCSIQFKNLILYLLGINNNTKFTARYKFTPKCILQGTKENQIDFLRSLIDCDSYYNKKRNTLGYFTASEKLAREVQLMLLNLDIYSSLNKIYKKEYDHIYYEIWITGEDVKKYFNLIQYSLKYNCPNKLENIKGKNDFHIPYLMKYTKNQINKLRKLLNVQLNGMFFYKTKHIYFKMKIIYRNCNTRQKINRKMLLEHYEELKNFIIYDKENIIFNLIKIYKKFLNNEDLLYIKVKSKKELNENKTVYDFTIPIYHSFYANGMINHNTAIACNILKQGIRNGLKVQFILAGTLISDLMKLQGFKTDEEIYYKIKNLKKQDLILIDDIGDINKSIYWVKSENKNMIISEWDLFLREVVASDTKVILTSNFDVTIFKQYFGESLYELIDRNFKQIQLIESVKGLRKLNVDEAFGEIE